MIEFQCACGKRLKAQPELAGKSVRCPKCQAKVAVPALAVAVPVAASEVPETYAIPAPVIAPPPIPEIDEEFVAYDPVSESESDDELDELPSRPAPRRQVSEPQQHARLDIGGDAFFRYFAAVWWCSVVLRVVGIIIYLSAGLSGLAMLLSVVGLFSGGAEDLPPGLQAFGGMAMIAMWLFVILIQITLGSIFYAAAQLITAQSWRYLQHGIGGGGLL